MKQIFLEDPALVKTLQSFSTSSQAVCCCPAGESELVLADQPPCLAPQGRNTSLSASIPPFIKFNEKISESILVANVNMSKT